MLNKVIEKITEQQEGKENTAVYYVGEQLKDICRTTPGACELVAHDLDIPEMSIAECEKKIKAYATSHGGCTPPPEADRIIKEFYGIPIDENSQTIGNLQEKPTNFVDLGDFI